jgi:predicted ribosome quality control (RQC) complex YloA/Tae2 family protein
MPNAQAYAKLHRQYLETEHPDLYKRLKSSGELLDHSARVGKEAAEYYETVAAQMATAKNLPEDYAERVERLEQIPHIVSELVMHDVIYNYPRPKP